MPVACGGWWIQWKLSGKKSPLTTTFSEFDELLRNSQSPWMPTPMQIKALSKEIDTLSRAKYSLSIQMSRRDLHESHSAELSSYLRYKKRVLESSKYRSQCWKIRINLNNVLTFMIEKWSSVMILTHLFPRERWKGKESWTTSLDLEKKSGYLRLR